MGRCRQSKVTEVISTWSEMGTMLVEQLPLITAGRCALNLSARFLFGLSWINSRARRSNLTYFYSGSSSAPGESDNLTYIIFYYDFVAFIMLNVFTASLPIGHFRPPVGLAPFYVHRFPWAACSDHSINYNALISKFLITSLMGFHIRLQFSSGYFG